MKLALLTCAVVAVLQPWGFTWAQIEEGGNSLVTCAACQNVQAQDWSCEVNCQVAKGNSDGVITIGVISELREKVNQLKKKNNQLEESLNQVNQSSIEEMRKLKETVNELNETLTEQNKSIYKLERARCAFGTSGSFGDRTIDNSAIPFNIVDLNTCDGYDANTGEFTATIAGTYMFNMHVRSLGVDSGNIFIKKNDARICTAYVSQGGGVDISACSGVTHLVPGDKVKVTGDNSYLARISGTQNGFNGTLI